MQAVILCGGKGIRLRPLTDKTPKPMLMINGKPFLEHQILYLKSQGITDFVLCAGHLWEQIRGYFGDGSKLGVKIGYSIEKKLLGTGGALKLAEKYLDGTFFVIYGDSFLPINYREAYDKARKTNKICVLVVYDNEEDTSVKNNIALDENGLVVKYDKISFDENMKFVDAGVMVTNKKILELIPPNQRVSLENELFARFINIQELASIKTKQRFYDIGTPERLREIEKILK